MSTFFEQLQTTLNEQTTERVMEEFVRYEIPDNDMSEWIAQVEKACLCEAHNGNTSFQLRLYNMACPRLLPEIGKVLSLPPTENQQDKVRYIGGRAYMEYALCPKGYYFWLMRMIERKEGKSFNDTAKRMFGKMIQVHVKHVIHLLVDAWHSKNPDTEANVGLDSIIIDWKEERVTKRYKSDSN